MDKDKLHRALAHIAAGADKMAQAAQEVLTPLAGTSKETTMSNQDRAEYAVEVKHHGVWVMSEDSYWGPYSVALVRHQRTKGPSRLVRRHAGEKEVIHDG